MSPGEHHTPITSPMGSDVEGDAGPRYKPELAKLPSSPVPQEPVNHIVTPVTPNSTRRKKHVKIEAPSSPLDRSGSAKKPQRYSRDAPPWRASYLSKFSKVKGIKKNATIDLSDSDSDLEILPPQPSNAMRKLAELAGVKTITSKASSTTNQRQDLNLISSLKAKQREQILKDREEKEALMKARGVVDEAHEDDEEDLKEKLWDEAKRSAALIRKREKEMEKAKGKVDNGDSDEEEAEFKIDIDDIPESDVENDSDGDLVVGFNDDEADVDADEDAEDESEVEEDADMALFENKDEVQVPSTLAQLEDKNDVTESDNEDGDLNLTFKSTSKRRRAHISNDDDEDAEAIQPTVSATISDPFGGFTQTGGELSMSQMFEPTQIVGIPAGLSMTQMFEATQAETVKDGANVLRAAANYFPTQDENIKAVIVETDESQEFTQQINDQDTQATQSRRNTFDNEIDHPPTQLSQFPPPTPMPSIKRPAIQDLWDDDSDVEEKEEDLVVKPGLRRLKQRPEREETAPSDEDDATQATTQAITQAVAKKVKKPQTKWDKEKAREIADEEAVESDDEWAGLGGNSDDEMDPELAAELLNMVDDSGNANEGEADLQKLFAQKERSKDEELVNKLMHDVANGGWRKKRRGNGSLLDGLSDEDDDEDDRKRNEHRRRRARQEAKRREKLLEDNDKLSAMSRNPKAAAFLKAIADSGSFLDSKHCFADDSSEEEESDEEVKKVTAAVAVAGPQITPADTQMIEPESEYSSRSNSMGPPSTTNIRKEPSTATKDKTLRKKRKLTTEYIRETLSFLDDDVEPKIIDDSWEPSRTLGDAIEETQLIGDDEEDEEEYQNENMLGMPGAGVFAKPTSTLSISMTSNTRVINRRQERRTLVAHGNGANAVSTVVEADMQSLDIVDLAMDDDDDEIVFKGSSFASASASFRTSGSFHTVDASNLGAKTANSTTTEGGSGATGYVVVTIGGGSTGVSSKASVNYQQKRKLGVSGSKRHEAAQNIANKVKNDAVKKAIQQRQQSSIFSQGSWN